MLTEDHHPCQALADLMTLRERFGDVAGLRLAYVGDGNNTAHSLMVLGAKAGLEVVVATPPELAPASVATDGVTLTDDPSEAAAGADVLYTDVWVSMGDDQATAEQRRAALARYRIDDALLDRAAPHAFALHCLPAHPGEEITEHFDFIDPEIPHYREELARHGERVVTFLIYLNDDYKGGETAFPHLSIRHKGHRGEALFFVNTLPNGSFDKRTLHAGRAPTDGEKWIVSQFVRDRPTF
jgi:ornithine carbamoyltransferase